MIKRIRNYLDKLCYLPQLQLRYLLSRSVKSNYFILSTHRSGTNLLVSLLNHVLPESCHTGEPLHEWVKGKYGLQLTSKEASVYYVRCVLNSIRGDMAGMKIMYHQLNSNKLSVKKLREEFPDSKIIVLYRRNIFEQYISFRLAKKTKVWVANDEYIPLEANKIEISEDKFRYFEHYVREAYRVMFDELGNDPNVCILEYERVCKDEMGTLKKIAECLGVNHVNLEGVKKPNKIITKNYDEYVTNISQLSHLFSSQQEY